MNPIQEGAVVNVKIKLSLFWTSLMFCYVYADILGFYAPGNLAELLNGQIAGIRMTQGWLAGSAALMTLPVLMIVLSLVLKAGPNRLVNIIAGFLHIGLLGITFITGRNPAYYILLAGVKAALIILIIVLAWRWRNNDK